ncbi:Rossmann-like domain-containing protein, partial [Hungatella sp.]
EYILPDMDYIYITGFTLVNKTLPRLLELGKNARVVLVGPSVPMAPVLFEFGVRELAGTLITDTEKTERLVRFGSHRAVVRSGIPVRAGYEE